MSKLTKADILNIARISYIKLSDDELNDVFVQIDSVLNYAAFLNNVAKTAKGAAADRYSLPTNINVVREDISIDSNPQILLNCSPDRQEDYFVVPSIIKQD